MHGAYDLSLTRGTEDQDIDQTRNLNKLPKNLRYANDHFRGSNPWPRFLLPGDFILIAEFSEHEGPKPVMTIPKNGAGNFDINAFAVHVMSVDYQVQSRRSNFSMVEDTQLFLTEAKQNIFAYVHYFTLYDIHARGFVRPFCMCYISHYKRKMMSFLDQLMDEFTKVSRLFRYGNRSTFSMDLEQRLADVFAMRDVRNIVDCQRFADRPWKGLSEGIGSSKTEMNKDFEYILKETRRLISVLKPCMNDPRIEEQFKRLESLAEGRNCSYSTDHTTLINQRARRHKLHSSFGKPEPFRKVVSLPDLRNHVQRTKEVHTNPFLPSYLHSFKPLRHLHELCEWGTKEAINRLGNILKHFGRDSAALMIEEMDARHLERLPSLLTIGRSVVCNVLQSIDMKCLRHRSTNCCCSKSLHQGSPTRKSSSGSLGSLYSLESFESCLDSDLPGSARSSNGIISPFTPSCCFHADLHGDETPRESRAGSVSEDSDVVSLTLSDTTLTFPEQHFNEYVLLDEHPPSTLKDMRPSFGRQTSAMLTSGIYTNVSIQTARKSLSLESLVAVSSDNTSSTCCMIRPPLPYFRLQVEGPSVARSRNVKVPAINVVESDGRRNSSSSSSSKSSLFGRALKRAKSDESSDICSLDGGNKSVQRKFNFLRTERIRLRCFAEEVCQAVETYAGSNVLLLRRNWSCIIHLVFALLCGRPVVVLADPGNEREVRTLISALWMFIPENTSCGKVAVPWRKKPLQIADLAWLKLAGLAKRKRCNVIPKSVKRFVSVLDYEAGLIATPPYKGYYLHSICNLTKQWPTNAALVAFIHSVFLELANKCYVFYYAHCLRGLQLCGCKSRRLTCGPVTDVYGDGSDVLSKLGVHFSDAKIVQYLTEVIKQQQIDYQQNLSTEQELSGEDELVHESESPEERRSPLIVTDLSKCALFRNVKPLEF